MRRTVIGVMGGTEADERTAANAFALGRLIASSGWALLSGGRATIVGTLLGALVIQLVRYTLLANGVPDPAALVVKAGLIVLAVWLQRQEQS